MTLGLYSHPDIGLHDKQACHVAMAETRIQAITDALTKLEGIANKQAYPASLAQLAYAHDPTYLAYLASSTELRNGKQIIIAPDTALNRYSWPAMLLSAGAVCQAVSDVLEHRVRHAFCVGYAGHHAEYARGGGFCFINSALVGTHAGLTHRLGITRIAVLDFDTHSGNGTILGLFDRPGEVLFAETYQPGYPGAFLQKRTKPSHILRKKCARRIDFLHAWERLFETVLAFEPELVLVSAGFDAHQADPLGVINLHDEDYAWLAERIRGLGGPVVAMLEGGYSTPDVIRCASLFVSTLADEP